MMLTFFLKKKSKTKLSCCFLNVSALKARIPGSPRGPATEKLERYGPRLKDFVMPDDDKIDQRYSNTSFDKDLRPLDSLKSLNIDLSWTPFDSTAVPISVEQLVDVEEAPEGLMSHLGTDSSEVEAAEKASSFMLNLKQSVQEPDIQDILKFDMNALLDFSSKSVSDVEVPSESYDEVGSLDFVLRSEHTQEPRLDLEGSHVLGDQSSKPCRFDDPSFELDLKATGLKFEYEASPSIISLMSSDVMKGSVSDPIESASPEVLIQPFEIDCETVKSKPPSQIDDNITPPSIGMPGWDYSASSLPRESLKTSMTRPEWAIEECDLRQGARPDIIPIDDEDGEFEIYIVKSKFFVFEFPENAVFF